jgi:hypothetical protein
VGTPSNSCMSVPSTTYECRKDCNPLKVGMRTKFAHFALTCEQPERLQQGGNERVIRLPSAPCASYSNFDTETMGLP